MFTPKNQASQIYCHPTYGPYFGNDTDFCISNNADQSNCTANINYGFTN